MLFNLFGKKNKKVETENPTTHLSKGETLEFIKLQRAAFEKDRLIDFFEWHYIDEIQPLGYPTKRNFEVLGDKKVIESDFFLITNKQFVCFCNLTSNKEYGDYIAAESSNIATQLKNRGWDFVHFPAKINDVEALSLSYFFPYANWDEQTISQLNNIEIGKTLGNQIAAFYNYDGPAKTGFVYFSGKKFVFVAKKKAESITDFVQQYLAAMPSKLPGMLYAMPPGYDYELDVETASYIHQIKLNLEKLKENGQFFSIAPTLFKIIEEASIATPKISRMLVDSEYRIILPDYQNREIKLSHLTKSLYLLLLKHHKGLYFPEFKIYEAELFEIYKKVSNRTDLDKMRESISELGNQDGKNIRTHISRIKSAFAKEFSDFYASKYYVIGGDVKLVLLDRQLLTWVAEI